MKSIAGLDELAAKKPELAQAWIYAKLTAFLIAERNAGDVPESPPLNPASSPNVAPSPSRWRVLKMAFAAVRDSIRGRLRWQDILNAIDQVFSHLCEPRRKRRQQWDQLLECLT
jgi:hypothetical protein